MKNLNILKGNISQPEILESIKCNLDLLGVNAFTIDFETNVISIMTPKNVAQSDLDCALLKAGVHCVCEKKCNLFEK
jgi:hypothetical protein